MKLKKSELALKLAVISVLAEAGYFLLTLAITFPPSLKYVVLPLALLAIIIIAGISDNRKIRSFYFKDNYMTIAVNKRESAFSLLHIESLDLLTDFDSLFGYKKVIINLKNTRRKYVLLFPAETARRFIFWLQAKLENYTQPFIDDLYLFLEEGNADEAP